MYQFDAGRTAKPLRGDHILSASVLLLTGLGLVTLYSSSFIRADRFSSQIKPLILGIALFFLAASLPLNFVRKQTKWLLLLVGILCVLPFVPGIGMKLNGAARWINIGFQPSELVKPILPLYLAHILDKKKDSLGYSISDILKPLLITGLFLFLIFMQNNISTAIFIALNALAIFFLAGVRMRHLIVPVITLLPLSALMILSREHRVLRILGFLSPGYQANNSILAITSGRFLGKGIGQGTWKIARVPEIQSDFIFSAFAEESGFLGVLLFFILFAVFAFQGYRAVTRGESFFNRLLAFGLSTMIVSQALLNVAVAAGLLPVTGMTLPFFSAGGSSLVVTLASAGLIANVCRQTAADGGI